MITKLDSVLFLLQGQLVEVSVCLRSFVTITNRPSSPETVVVIAALVSSEISMEIPRKRSECTGVSRVL